MFNDLPKRSEDTYTNHAEPKRHIELMESDSRFIGMEATWRCEFSSIDSSESYDLLITRYQKGVTRELRFYSEFPFLLTICLRN